MRIKGSLNLIEFLQALFLFGTLLFLLFVIFTPKTEDGATRMFGRELRLVTTDSMTDTGYVDTSDFEIKSFPKNTLIAVDCVPKSAEDAAKWYDEIEVGDVLTFRYSYDRAATITHRVIDKIENGRGGYFITLSGDNKDSEHTRLDQIIDTSAVDSPNYVIGKVTWTSEFFGSIVGTFQRIIKALSAT
jgi:hypothetical protein